jgi:hypothetical protein
MARIHFEVKPPCVVQDLLLAGELAGVWEFEDEQSAQLPGGDPVAADGLAGRPSLCWRDPAPRRYPVRVGERR